MRARWLRARVWACCRPAHPVQSSVPPRSDNNFPADGAASLAGHDDGADGFGAADRFEKVGIINTEENRRLYRQMLYAVPNGP